MATVKSLNLKVHPTENGAVLIDVLSNRLGVSRNKAKEIIDQRRVFINGRRVWMARHCLKPGDNITGSFSAEKSADIKSSIILYEDRDYLIVNKPAGISSNGPNSVEELLNKQSGNDSSAACHVDQAGGMARRMACHRLDKDTSGCLIFGKSAKAKERIIALFARNEIAKKYEAIIRGRLPKETMTIATPIDGQKAITHISLLAATQSASPAGLVLRSEAASPLRRVASGASHVSISIETGRTHQIRKHLASIGHPVLGDQHYGTGGVAPEIERSIARQMLHAAEVKFRSPLCGSMIHGRAELPQDFMDCLKLFKLDKTPNRSKLRGIV